MAPQEKRPSHILYGPTLVSFVACQRWGQVSEATLYYERLSTEMSTTTSRHKAWVTGPAVPLPFFGLCGAVLRKFDMPMRTSWKLNVAQCDVIPKISMTSLIVINVPISALLDGEAKVSFVGDWQICKKMSSLLSSSVNTFRNSVDLGVCAEIVSLFNEVR